MAQWRIKEISDLTKISVRMLHHYDKIGLLKPSVRASNGYRYYSEGDLVKLQQIIALKFFGFGLSQIKTMLQQQPSIHEHLLTQQQLLAKQSEDIQQTQDALVKVLEQCKASKSLDWNDLITLIERYRMAKELKKTWAGKLSEKQQDRYLTFKQKFPKETDAWDKIIDSINNGQMGDPDGFDGERAVKAFFDFHKAALEKEKNEELNKSKKESWTNAEVMGDIKANLANSVPFSPEASIWFGKALNAYYLKSWELIYQDIAKNIDADPAGVAGKKIAAKWRELLSQNCMGAPIDFFLGTQLVLKTVKSKVALQEKMPEDFNLKLAEAMQEVKLFTDIKVLDWIYRALKSN